MTDHAFRLYTLPAGNGDALVVEYGSSAEPRHVLVDAGVGNAAAAVRSFLGASRALELLIVTHIDNDHISGVLQLLEGTSPPRPKDVWFNGYRHLPESAVESMGPVEGERLSAILARDADRWNAAFGGKAVATKTPLPTGTLDGGLRWTLLSPGAQQLRRLRQTWTAAIQEAGLDPAVAPPPTPAPGPVLEAMGPLDVDSLADSRTVNDTAPANGSSIAVLFRYGKRTCLLAADAHPDVLIGGVDELLGPAGVLHVDVFKLPHHGSKANVTNELLRRIQARTYVFSTDGSGNQRHPNDQAVARVLKYGGSAPVLAFNYRSERNQHWDDPELKRKYGYETRYPVAGSSGIAVDVG
ncbi:beta-lactamase superfamily II metal-dependent hydrolase [Mycolicibacterium sp. BK634]|uniref:ComEC/Rec2 family competence protein n=1 Tax=Mycolicibacterium sp. BK634 TaxID=2587099 RepID=UPI00161B4537|nr:MBL fold metallo-hydrolase [Mycolicibacterium sp. BK634]MBB3753769.1 beta-lactamase superfamily II metal-dependent hydrolase [Mycolicibacterium sp. BK634]